MADLRPIGVFDSGLGGLSVLSQIHKMLPGESTLYLGDLARLPYGSKCSETVIRYSLNNARTLMAKAPIKMLVVACGTASTHALSILRETLPIPVIGIIDAAAEQVAKSKLSRVALLATQSTIEARNFERTIYDAGFKGQLVPVACPLFVPIVEEGFVRGPIAASIANHYLGFLPTDTDAILLGCTHYPALKPLMENMVPKSIKWIDCGHGVAERVAHILQEQKIAAPSNQVAKHEYLVTDAANRFVTFSEIFLDNRILPSQVELVDVA